MPSLRVDAVDPPFERARGGVESPRLCLSSEQIRAVGLGLGTAVYVRASGAARAFPAIVGLLRGDFGEPQSCVLSHGLASVLHCAAGDAVEVDAFADRRALPPAHCVVFSPVHSASEPRLDVSYLHRAFPVQGAAAGPVALFRGAVIEESSVLLLRWGTAAVRLRCTSVDSDAGHGAAGPHRVTRGTLIVCAGDAVRAADVAGWRRAAIASLRGRQRAVGCAVDVLAPVLSEADRAAASAVALVGGAGSGAVAAVEAALQHAPCAVVPVDAASLYRAQEGSAEAVLARAADAAIAAAPAVMLVRRPDALFGAGAGSDGGGELPRRLWLLLLRVVARVSQHPRCAVITAVEAEDSDADLARVRSRVASLCARVEEVSLTPDTEEAYALLASIPGWEHGPPGSSSDGDSLALALCQLPYGRARSALRRALREALSPPPDAASSLPVDVDRVPASAVRAALEEEVKEAAAAGSLASPQRFTLADAPFEGHAARVRHLLRVVGLGLFPPPLFARAGTATLRGALLWGASGSGKTALARHVAARVGGRAAVLAVDCADVVAKVVGASSQNVARVFRDARASAPCLLVLDSVHVLAPPRAFAGARGRALDQVLSTLLVEIDGVRGHQEGRGVFVLATAPDKGSVDPAILRPGRLGEHVHLPPPRVADRARLIAWSLRATPLDAPASSGKTEEEEREGEDKGEEVVVAAAEAVWRRIVHQPAPPRDQLIAAVRGVPRSDRQGDGAAEGTRTPTAAAVVPTAAALACAVADGASSAAVCDLCRRAAMAALRRRGGEAGPVCAGDWVGALGEAPLAPAVSLARVGRE